MQAYLSCGHSTLEIGSFLRAVHTWQVGARSLATLRPGEGGETKGEKEMGWGMGGQENRRTKRPLGGPPRPVSWKRKRNVLYPALGTAVPIACEKCVLGGLLGARGPQGCSERALTGRRMRTGIPVVAPAGCRSSCPGRHFPCLFPTGQSGNAHREGDIEIQSEGGEGGSWCLMGKHRRGRRKSQCKSPEAGPREPWAEQVSTRVLAAARKVGAREDFVQGWVTPLFPGPLCFWSESRLWRQEDPLGVVAP